MLMAEESAEAVVADDEVVPAETSEEPVSVEPVDDGLPDLVASWGAAYASTVRIAAGLVGVVVDRAQEAARAKPEEETAQPEVEDFSDQEHVPGTVLFGFAADLPDRLARMGSSVADNTGFVRGIVGVGWRTAAASPIGWLISKPVDAVLEVVDAETERLSGIGRAEVAHGRVLVESVVDNTIDDVLDNVSESEALNELIREQAFGITDAAIQEVRETGAAADNLTDLAIRKLLRREPRELPPRPPGNSE